MSTARHHEDTGRVDGDMPFDADNTPQRYLTDLPDLDIENDSADAAARQEGPHLHVRQHISPPAFEPHKHRRHGSYRRDRPALNSDEKFV